METTASKFLSKLPDFEVLFDLVNSISEIYAKKLYLENKIKEEEAKTVYEVTTNEVYFMNGKPASMSYIDSTYKYLGINNSLVPLREELYKTISEVERLRGTLDIYKEMLGTWQTLSANERRTSL